MTALIACDGEVTVLDDSCLQTPVGEAHEGAIKGLGGPLFKLSLHLGVVAEIADVVDEIQNHEDFTILTQCVN